MGRKKKEVVKEVVAEVAESPVQIKDIKKEKIRVITSGMYDIQKLRIATGNRIVQSFNIQMGQAPSTKQEDMSDEAKKLIDKLREEYKLITDAYIDKKYAKDKDGKIIPFGKSQVVLNEDVPEKETKKRGVDVAKVQVIELKKNSSIQSIIESMTTDANSGINNIKSKLDYDLMKSYIELCNAEETQLAILEKEVKSHPLWDMFFKDVKGCGPLMAAVCLAYFDIDKARHVSSFWRYVGLDTVTYMKEDGTTVTEGRAPKHAKYNQVEYEKDGMTLTRASLGYNPFVRTKLRGVLADCMIKAGMRSEKDKDGNPVLVDGKKVQYALSDAKYVQIYLDYRNRLNNRPDMKDASDLKKHNMAARYMIKMFLRDLWTTWREYAGYEVSEPYEVAKLGMKPHKYNEAQCEAHERTKK